MKHFNCYWYADGSIIVWDGRSGTIYSKNVDNPHGLSLKLGYVGGVYPYIETKPLIQANNFNSSCRKTKNICVIYCAGEIIFLSK